MWTFEVRYLRKRAKRIPFEGMKTLKVCIVSHTFHQAWDNLNRQLKKRKGWASWYVLDVEGSVA